MPSMIGLFALLIAFAAVVISLICFSVAHVLNGNKRKKGAKKRAATAETFAYGAYVGVCMGAVALLVACGVLVWAFMTGDVSIDYVVRQRSDASGSLAWLYDLAGLWGGREGSLLFWAFLISLFNTVVAIRTWKRKEPLDCAALLIAQLVLAAFLLVLLFSEANMPFTVTDSSYLNEDGTLTNAASMLGMNALLEHWAMAIHPPTLFIGYAGMTLPFAYAMAALIVNDSSDTWVRRVQGYTIFAWLFLGIGIGLGAVWAYVVLGWGGYWGWDPVENASLLPWLVGLALIHSFTVYRQRGSFKRWCVMCACLAFSFVVLGTFITRSGLVESVHAFDEDPVSTALFLILIIASFLAGAIGLIVRRNSFKDSVQGAQTDSLFSRDIAYYVNNLVLVAFAVILAYLTVASALPEPLPFAGMSISAGTYEAIARPLGILYCLVIAVCPLLSWGRTSKADFLKRAKVPGICALVVFALLCGYFALVLMPADQAIRAAGGTAASDLAEYGPVWYYYALTIVGFAVAALLAFNAGFQLKKALTAKNRRFSGIGASVAHLSMGIILVGLIGSSMYVTEDIAYLEYNAETEAVTEDLEIGDYRLVFKETDGEMLDNDIDVLYTVRFDVYKGDEHLGVVEPSMQIMQATMQQKLNASVLSFPHEDLFVAFQGVSESSQIVIDARVNRLISFVWVGFGLLMVGIALSLIRRNAPARRDPDPAAAPATVPAPAPAPAAAPAKVPAPPAAPVPADAPAAASEEPADTADTAETKSPQ